MKYIFLIFFMFLTGCASVGPVEITATDTPKTIATAFVLGVVAWYIKSVIDYRFAKKLEKYKHDLNKEK